MATANIFKIINTYLEKPQLLEDHVALVNSVSPEYAREVGVDVESDRLVNYMLNDLLKANGRSVSELCHEFTDNFDVLSFTMYGADVSFSVTTPATLEINLATVYPVGKSYDTFRIDVAVLDGKYNLFIPEVNRMLKGFTSLKVGDDFILLEQESGDVRFVYDKDGTGGMLVEMSEGILDELGVAEEAPTPAVEKDPDMFEANLLYEALVRDAENGGSGLVQDVKFALRANRRVEDARNDLNRVLSSNGLTLGIYLERFDSGSDLKFWVNGCEIAERNGVWGITFIYRVDDDNYSLIKKNANGSYMSSMYIDGTLEKVVNLDSVDIRRDSQDSVLVYGYKDGELLVEGFDNYNRDVNDFTWLSVDSEAVSEDEDGVEDDFHIFNYEVTDKSVELNLGGGAIYTLPALHAVQDGDYCSFIFPEGVGRLSRTNKGIKIDLLIDGEVWSFERYREEIGG